MTLAKKLLVKLYFIIIFCTFSCAHLLIPVMLTRPLMSTQKHLFFQDCLNKFMLSVDMGFNNFFVLCFVRFIARMLMAFKIKNSNN